LISSNVRHTVVSEATGPEQLALVTQGVNRTDRGGTIGDGHRQISQHPTPIMHRPETGLPQRHRQCAGQPDPISRQPQQSRPHVRHHTMAAHFDGQTLRPRGNVHLESASHVCGTGDLEDPHYRNSEAPFAYQNTHPAKIVLDIGE
jgi:hypothetical protein